MSLTINTNLSSLIAQNSLKTSTNKLNTAIERMTTGYKINHAKDNAANYTIATQLSTKIGAYSVAEENALMGLDMVQTASSSLDLISDKLSRLRALATQAQNGTYGDESKSAINSEANALVDEIQRLYTTTSYNGIDLFKGKTTATSNSKFIQDITRQDTSKMTKLAEVDETKELAEGVYSILTAEELAKLATMTNNGLIGDSSEFVLGADIDLSAYSNWTPIGSVKHFRGSFNGNGYTISNLTASSSEQFLGLFGIVQYSCVQNIALENANINGNLYVGSLMGDAWDSRVENCYAENCTVKGSTVTGGLIGLAASQSTISDCYFSGNVTGNSYAGGLLGELNKLCTIKSSFSDAVVSAEYYAGGLIGSSSRANIYDSYALGSVSATNYCGGLIGVFSANALFSNDITNCYTKSTINSAQQQKGALLGLVSVSTKPDSQFSVNNITNCHYSDSSLEIIGGTRNVDEATLAKIFNMQGTSLIESNTDLFEISPSAKVTDTDSGISLQVGINSTDSSNISFDLGVSIGRLNLLRSVGIDESNMNILTIIDTLQIRVKSQNTAFGAVQNRLESALDSISVAYDNLVSSRSTIQDADIAEVSAEYIRQQILQQASATLMATANQSPAVALQLL